MIDRLCQATWIFYSCLGTSRHIKQTTNEFVIWRKQTKVKLHLLIKKANTCQVIQMYSILESNRNERRTIDLECVFDVQANIPKNYLHFFNRFSMKWKKATGCRAVARWWAEPTTTTTTTTTTRTTSTTRTTARTTTTTRTRTRTIVSPSKTWPRSRCRRRRCRRHRRRPRRRRRRRRGRRRRRRRLRRRRRRWEGRRGRRRRGRRRRRRRRRRRGHRRRLRAPRQHRWLERFPLQRVSCNRRPSCLWSTLKNAKSGNHIRYPVFLRRSN